MERHNSKKSIVNVTSGILYGKNLGGPRNALDEDRRLVVHPAGARLLERVPPVSHERVAALALRLAGEGGGGVQDVEQGDAVLGSPFQAACDARPDASHHTIYPR